MAGYLLCLSICVDKFCMLLSFTAIAVLCLIFTVDFGAFTLYFWFSARFYFSAFFALYPFLYVHGMMCTNILFISGILTPLSLDWGKLIIDFALRVMCACVFGCGITKYTQLTNAEQTLWQLWYIWHFSFAIWLISILLLFAVAVL